MLLSVGLGGFFDGIVFHQLLQRHHMVSSWYPPTTLENLRLNTWWDGIFHSTTYVLLVVALYLFWRIERTGRLYRSRKLLAGTVLLGWGAFDFVEGAVDHHLFGLHHVNETSNWRTAPPGTTASSRGVPQWRWRASSCMVPVRRICGGRREPCAIGNLRPPRDP